MYLLTKNRNLKYSVIQRRKPQKRIRRSINKHSDFNVELFLRSDNLSVLKQIATNLTQNIPRVLLKKIDRFTAGHELMSPDVLLKHVEKVSCIHDDDIKTAEHNISDGKLILSTVLKHTESPSVIQENVNTVNCKSSLNLILANDENCFADILSDHNYSSISTDVDKNDISNIEVALKDRNLGQDSCDVTFEEYSLGNKVQDIELSKSQDSQLTTEHTNEYSKTLDNNEIFLMEITPDSQLQKSSSPISIHQNEVLNSRNVQPKILSDLSGIFISKNGSLKFPHYTSDLEKMPIYIIETPIDQLKTRDQVADLSVTAPERANSLTELENSSFLFDDSHKTELNLVETSSTMEPNLKQLTMSSVPDSIIIADNNKNNEKKNLDVITQSFGASSDQNITEENDTENSSNSNYDDQSDSNSSYISELEDLERFDDVDYVDNDEIIRNSIASADDGVDNLSLSIELHTGNNLLEIRNSNHKKDHLNDTGLSNPILTDESRLSSSTLNNTKDDSSYVLPPDTTLDQSSELCTNIEDESTEHIQDVVDNEFVIQELIKKSKPPKLDDLKVPRAGEEPKKSFCCFCFQSFVVISGHYEAMHGDEKEVQHFLSLKKRSAERIAAIEKLRLKGNQLFNLNNDFNHGRLLVTRQPQKTSLANVHDFKPCHRCGRWLQYINRHKCPYGKESDEDRSGLVKSKILMGQISNNATSLTRKILAINNEDNISEAVKQDPLLVTFVNELSQKYTNPHQHSMIRSRVRMLGNILVKLKEYNNYCFKSVRIDQKCNPININTFADILDPRMYDNLIIAIQSIVGADAENNECKSPSTATTAGTWVTKIDKLYEKEIIKQREYNKAKDVDYFLKIHEVEFPIKVNSLARNVQATQKRYKQVLLPTMDDINRFRDFILKHLLSAYNRLENNFNFRTWKLLSQMTLIFFLLFNRKRPGELERVKIDDYKNADKFEKTNPEEYARLSADEKKIVDTYIRFEFGGKRGREVPLIMSNEMQKYVQRILDHRNAANVDPQNPHIFGLPSFDGTRYKYLHACELMRRFSKLCGAQHPERLRATELRKHFATTVASLKIDECQIYDISNFMGHAENIHRSYYRQSVVTRDLCGVSKILEVASGVPSVIPRAQTNAGSMLDQSEESCSNSANLKDDPINDMNSPFHEDKITEKNSSPNFTEEENSNDSNDSFLKQSKTKAQRRKRLLEFDSSSDNELEEEKVAKKKRSKKPAQKKIDLNDVLPKRNNTKTAWSEEERRLVFDEFSSCIENMKCPSVKCINEFISEHPIMHRRTEPQVRLYIHNQYAGKLKELKEKKKLHFV